MSSAPASLKAHIVATQFNRMLHQLAAIEPRIDYRHIIHSEAAAVVRTAMQRTKAAKLSSLRARYEHRDWITYNATKYSLNNFYPAPLWAAITQKWKQSAKIAYASRGLSKKSWLHLSGLIGTPIHAQSYVRNANYKGRDYPQNAATTETGSSPNNYALTILNRSPIVQLAGGQRALLSAMSGRTAYFRRSMAKGFHTSLARRARAYPGIWVNTTANPF